MIVPQYWAESRIQHREKDRQVTIRRFGWSDSSQDEAQKHADSRAQEALRRVLSGEKISRRDLKVPYNGAEGVPIREEIISRHGETLITRNSYGARCLNTPGVFFADLDFDSRPAIGLYALVIGVLFTCSGAAGSLLNSRVTVFLLCLGSLIFCGMLTALLDRLIQTARGGAEKAALERTREFIAGHPEWNLRIYRTPAGLRVMATHKTFSPRDPEVEACFKELKTDRLYARMCANQLCFRARVSPKPWRIGIGEHMRPRPGVWPVAPERLHLRQSWVKRYEASAKSFSACRLLEVNGSGLIHPDIKPIQELHDKLCKVSSGLPIA